MHERDALLEEATKHGDVTLLADYKRKRNEVKRRQITDEAEFYEKNTAKRKMQHPVCGSALGPCFSPRVLTPMKLTLFSSIGFDTNEINLVFIHSF